MSLDDFRSYSPIEFSKYNMEAPVRVGFWGPEMIQQAARHKCADVMEEVAQKMEAS